MDLSSVNKFNNIYQNKLNFKGVKGTFDAENTPVFKFNPPPFDKTKEQASLEFVLLGYDAQNNAMVSPDEKDIIEEAFEGDKPLIISQDYVLDSSKGFAYRYKISPKPGYEGQTRYVVDAFAKINLKDNKGQMNLIRTWDNYQLDSKTGAMRHSFLDSDAILTKGKDGKATLAKDKHIVRNHFNKLGGSTKGLNYLLTQTDELDPYRYIISTPDIGNDPTSSHKYWPNNLYQCGNVEDFKEFNFQLYKRGKGYVADGAFTDQSIQSPMFQHVLKWGSKSPFYHMFKMEGKPVLGVLPNRLPEGGLDNWDHIGFRIVNNPKDVTYKKDLPTYIQLYDDRLSSASQRNNSKKLINAYDSVPEDIFEITSNEDSVYPFYFEIDINDPNMKKKLDLFNDKNALTLNEIRNDMTVEDFLDFGNFTLTDRYDAAGATFWDGNRDIVKLNLSNPVNRIDGDTSEENLEGFRAAREYMFGVATYWTEMVQSDLILRTAMMSDSDKREVALKNDISPERYEKLAKLSPETHFPVLERNKTIEEYLEEFPFQSLEVSPELTAVFAEPQFRDEFLDIDTKQTLYEMVEFVIDAAIPEKYKYNEEYRTYVTKAYANTIIKFILAASLNPLSIDERTADNNYSASINYKELKKVTLKSLVQDPSSPEEERIMVSESMKNLLGGNITPLINEMRETLQGSEANGFKGISLEDFKLADSIVLQGKAGLNWRFDAAKDIGDLDSVREGTREFKDVWDSPEGVVEFWHDFISNVKEYNPSPYIIAELTDLWSFYNSNKPNAREAFDKNGHDPNVKERDFLVEIGATTNSNYSQYFNKLSCFAGVNPEVDEGAKSRAGNLDALKNTINQFINDSQPMSAISTHEFTDNHDKPRVLHALPLNMSLYLCRDKHNNEMDLESFFEYLSQDIDNQRWVNKYREIISELTGRYDFENINPKAIAVGLMMYRQIKTLEIDDGKGTRVKAPQEYQEALIQALRELVNGQKDENDEPNYKRAHSFGTKPYEVTIREMYKRAQKKGLKINDIDEEVKNFHYSMLSNSMDKLERTWQMMNAIVGTPTLFNGTEFAQTGYETPSKNVYVDNRNQILHELKNDKRYAPFYNKLKAVSELYQQPQMSALRDGFPIVGKVTKPAHISRGLYDKNTVMELVDVLNKTTTDGDAFKKAEDFFNKKKIYFTKEEFDKAFQPANGEKVEYTQDFIDYFTRTYYSGELKRCYDAMKSGSEYNPWGLDVGNIDYIGANVANNGGYLKAAAYLSNPDSKNAQKLFGIPENQFEQLKKFYKSGELKNYFELHSDIGDEADNSKVEKVDVNVLKYLVEQIESTGGYEEFKKVVKKNGNTLQKSQASDLFAIKGPNNYKKLIEYTNSGELERYFIAHQNGDDYVPPKTDDVIALRDIARKIYSHGGYGALELFFDTNLKGDRMQALFGISPGETNENVGQFVNYFLSGKLSEYFDVLNQNKKETSFLPIFKYDDKGSQVLSIITNNGVPKSEYANQVETKLENCEVDSIDITADNGSSPLPNGTILSKMVYDGKSYKKAKDETYIVKDGRLYNKNGGKIKLEDTVVHFFVDRAKVIAANSTGAYGAK